MSITLRKLEVFVSIADSGSVTRTSEKLLISQSAVSMALADLEKQYHNTLFHRQGRKLHLNERGRLLLPLAREILLRAHDFEQQLIASANEPAGQLQVGASTTIGNYLLPLLVAQFSRSYPKAQIFMRVGNSEVIAEALDRGELDLALIEGPCHLKQLQPHFWREDQLVVIVAQEHPWADKGQVELKELLQADWIVREVGSGTREVFERALELPLTKLKSLIELGHTEAIKKAVEANLGVSCLSRLAVARELASGWLVEVPTPLALTRSLNLLLPSGRRSSHLLRAFLEMLIPDFQVDKMDI